LTFDVERWLQTLESRHTRDMRRQDLLKAIRALSVRYVERRTEIGSRSPIDSAGKRAAFAAFFAPLHFLIAREIVRAIDRGRARIDQLLDLGCGTGVASAAWSLELQQRPAILGIDRDRRVLREASWNWRQMGAHGRVRQDDFVRHLTHAARRAPDARTPSGIVVGWSVNELAPEARAALLTALLRLGSAGTAILVIEPVARRVSPWWTGWAQAFTQAGGRADEWRFETPLPDRLAELSEAAGFRREALTARSLWLRNPNPEP
jgi:SAM-dependent methyltransferase